MAVEDYCAYMQQLAKQVGADALTSDNIHQQVSYMCPDERSNLSNHFRFKNYLDTT